MNTKIDPARKDSTINWMDLQPGMKVREWESEKEEEREEQEEEEEELL
jgi:hypothetical protein